MTQAVQVLNKVYEGSEDGVDLARDVSEAVEMIVGEEYIGQLSVHIVYRPAEPGIEATCPFCHSTSLTVSDGGGYHYVLCDECECEGPPAWGEDGVGAIEAWNKREKPL